MISRPEPMSAAAAASLFRSAVDGKSIAEVLDRIMECAKGQAPDFAGLDDKERAKLQLEYRRLVLSYGIGRARAQGLVCFELDLGDLSTLDGCVAAMQAIAANQHEMTTEQARDLRETVTAAASILRSRAGEAILEEIESAGGIVEFAGVGESRESILGRIGRRLEGDDHRGN